MSGNNTESLSLDYSECIMSCLCLLKCKHIMLAICWVLTINKSYESTNEKSNNSSQHVLSFKGHIATSKTDQINKVVCW